MENVLRPWVFLLFTGVSGNELYIVSPTMIAILDLTHQTFTISASVTICPNRRQRRDQLCLNNLRIIPEFR